TLVVHVCLHPPAAVVLRSCPTRRSSDLDKLQPLKHPWGEAPGVYRSTRSLLGEGGGLRQVQLTFAPVPGEVGQDITRLVQVEDRSEEHTSELQSRENLVCRLLREKKESK